MKTNSFEISNSDNKQSQFITKDIIKFGEFINIFDRMLDVSPTKEPHIDITSKLDTNINIEHIYINVTDGENTEQFSIPVGNLCSFIINEKASLMFCSFTKQVVFSKYSQTTTNNPSELLKHNDKPIVISCGIFGTINPDTTDAIVLCRWRINSNRLDGITITPVGYDLRI